MGKKGYYQYFVEGEDEEKLIHVLKTELRLILPGRVQKFNVTQQRLTKLRVMSLKPGTTVILIFDTDAGNPDILNENVVFLKKSTSVKEVFCIPQVKNLEDELKRSCKIKQIRELTGSRSNSDYKHDLIKDSRLAEKLKNANFDISVFWNSVDTGIFKHVINEAKKVKCLK